MEMISYFTYANARGLARLAAFMANKGSLNGKELLSEETWENMLSEPKPNMLSLTNINTVITKSGIN
jgi:CubicO group peptidase (beta-lactamase class C family)